MSLAGVKKKCKKYYQVYGQKTAKSVTKARSRQKINLVTFFALF
jgi:hypothetical protein